MNLPDNIKYTEDHEWVKLDADILTIGITDFAQSELGDIIFVEPPQLGETFRAGDIFGTLEAVKTVADLYMPIGSEILQINEKIDSNPEIINSDPEGEGWIVKVKIENEDELNKLLTEDQYRELIK